jgi:PAS domain S-box-containing protein
MVNSAVERQLGYTRDELLNRSIDQLVPENLREQHAQHRASYLGHPEPRMMGAGRDLSALAKDGSMVPVEVGLNPVTQDGRVGALATIVDISERKKLEQRTLILAGEVSHRARNLLAVVRALALRKLPRQSATEFVGTLDALARTQEVFGRKTVAPLRSILEAELAGFGAQTSISGCDVKLTPSAGQDFSLICHELATNAAKYGALSTRAGSIKVVGEAVSEDLFQLLWTEEGGPEIAGPPDQTNFGLKMLNQLAKGMSADLEMEFLPQGLRFKLTVPMNRITNVRDIPVALRA